VISSIQPKRQPSIGNVSVSALDSLSLPRHRWYFFKEAFSPEIVKRAAEDADCGPSDLVVDPFCGSGTVPLQAALTGYRSRGTEVNPFLAFVARAKLSHCKPAALEPLLVAATRGALKGRRSPLREFSTFTKRSGLSKWLFSRSVLDAFEGAWTAVDDVATSSTPSQTLMRLCLIGAAMDACNAVKDGKCLRYRPGWTTKAFGARDFIAALETRAAMIAADLEAAPLVAPDASVRRADAREPFRDGPFRLCVTSPPYLNSFDYTDVYRPELFLGKWVKDMKDLRALRLKTIRSHVQVEWPDPTRDDFGSHYVETMAALRPCAKDLWNGRLPRMVQAYFEDMRRVLRNLRVRAQKNASVWIVVSTSAYGGIEIPVDLIIAEIAAGCRWYLREVSVLRYLGRVAGQQWSELSEAKARGPHLRESLVILDAQPRRS